jgi:hypothetical protein
MVRIDSVGAEALRVRFAIPFDNETETTTRTMG